MSKFALRLPDSLMAAARAAAERDDTSMNQLFATAIGEKLSALETETLLADRAARADAARFAAVLGHVADRPADEEAAWAERALDDLIGERERT